MRSGTIILSGQAHGYRVQYSRRRTLGVYVSRNLEIEVRAPLDCPPGVIRGFVDSKSSWLADSLARLGSLPAPVRWADGASHLYQGERLTLALRRGRRALVVRDGTRLLVTLADDRPERVQSAVRNWYRQQASGLFQRSLDAWYPALKLPESRRPALTIRAMRRRWGSCSSRGGITLNLWLIRAPQRCLDYVVVHELCHLHEFNHSPAFYGWMDRVMPDWRTHRQALCQHEREAPSLAG